MADGVVDAVAGACGGRQSFVTDEEVEVFGAALCGEVTARSSAARQEGGLVRNSRAAGARTSCAARRALGRNGRGEHERGGVVAGETCIAPASMLCCGMDMCGSCTKLRVARAAAEDRQYAIPRGCRELGAGAGAYLSMTTAGVLDAIFAVAHVAVERMGEGRGSGRETSVVDWGAWLRQRASRWSWAWIAPLAVPLAAKLVDAGGGRPERWSGWSPHSRPAASPPQTTVKPGSYTTPSRLPLCAGC